MSFNSIEKYIGKAHISPNNVLNEQNMEEFFNKIDSMDLTSNEKTILKHSAHMICNTNMFDVLPDRIIQRSVISLVNDAFDLVNMNILRYIIYSLEYNFICRKIGINEMKPIQFINFKRKKTSETKIIWKYIFAKIDVMNPLFKSFAETDEEFLKVINKYGNKTTDKSVNNFKKLSNKYYEKRREIAERRNIICKGKELPKTSQILIPENPCMVSEIKNLLNDKNDKEEYYYV